MEIYIAEDESYPVYFFKKSKFCDGDEPRKISLGKYNWIIATTEEYGKVQKFLGELNEWTYPL